jgi:hypothetical protein
MYSAFVIKDFGCTCRAAANFSSISPNEFARFFKTEEPANEDAVAAEYGLPMPIINRAKPSQNKVVHIRTTHLKTTDTNASQKKVRAGSLGQLKTSDE